MDHGRRPPERVRLAVVAGGGALLTGAVVVLMLETAAPHHRVFAAVVYALVVALPMGVGAWVLARRPDDRFAWLLIGAGVAWSTVALAGSTEPVPYSVGRVAVWVAEPILLYLLLAFPSGRLPSIAERRVALSGGLLAALLYMPTALLVQRFPEPGVGTTCDTHCPANALALASHTPAFVDTVVRPLREVLLVALYVAVAVVLARRSQAAQTMLRRALVPVLAIAVLRIGLTVVFEAVRRGDPDAEVLETLGWLYVLSVPLFAGAVATGLLLRQVYAATALERLAQRLRGSAGAAELRPALADALEDPSLRIVHWRDGEPGRWIDDAGWPTPAPEDGPGVAVTEITADGRRVAAIVHDPALAHDPALMQAAGSYALAMLENSRLVGRLRTTLADLSRSRTRLVQVGDDVRRDIERDLHDGAQQRLVALRIELALQSERVNGHDPETSLVLDELGREVEQTIDDVRSLARGIYPSVLAEQGLGPALRAAALASPIPASVDVDGIRRFRPEVESAVYFICLEALQNAAKHARAKHIAITLTAGERLRFEIADDGEGFDNGALTNGAGLTNLRDRVAAIGGELEVASSRRGGTRVSGSLPVANGVA